VQEVVEALRDASYKTVKGLRTELDWAGAMSRDQFEDLLSAMLRARLIDVEDAEFEKDGRVIPYRKVRLTESGLELRATTPLEILISDGIVREFAGRVEAPALTKKARAIAKPGKAVQATALARSTPESQALVARLKEWRAAEAKRLGVPAFVVLHDRTLTAVAEARPGNPNQLLEIDGIGPAKVERFGEAILGMCAAAN
jgi:superfamily II DNA helicase RecQ